MNWGIDFRTPTYNVAHRVSPWLKGSYGAAFLALVPMYGIPASLAAAALAIRGVLDMPEARRLAWGMAAVPLGVAAITLVLGLLLLLGVGSPGELKFYVTDAAGVGQPAQVWMVLTLLTSFLLSVTIHEPAHAMVAYWFGDTTAADFGRLTFKPEKHINPFSTLLLPAISLFLGFFIGWASTPVTPSRMHPRKLGDISTSVAGPLSNLLLAGVSLHLFMILLLASGTTGPVQGLLYHVSYPFELSHGLLLAAYYLKVFAIFNIWLFLFNMLPIPMLDGGHVLLAVLPHDTADWLRRNGLILTIVIVMIAGQLIWEAQGWIARWVFTGLGLSCGVPIEG